MLTLVIGGSASGKSAFAERLAVQSGLPRFYVATMRVWDMESERRVARHRDMRREKRFDTLECPIGLDRLILPARGTVLLEDMGHLVANELYAADGAGRDAVEAAVLTMSVCVGGGMACMGGGLLVLAALAALWRYRAVAVKQFGGVTGDLAGWFLQRAELWMLAALLLSGRWLG